MQRSGYEKFGKRILDLFLTVPATICLAPLLAVLALLVRLQLGTPVIFRQRRPGLDGKPFTLCKFRTMTDQRDKQGNRLPDEQRLTSFGKFLRKSSLDELPELWNVLLGEMSLVGPRPLLMEYLERYTAFQARRHEVKPGLTGWAQVNGRNAIDWEKKFQLDVWYVDHCSLLLDLKILGRTLIEVIKRDNISAPGHATAPVFGANDRLVQMKTDLDLERNHEHRQQDEFPPNNQQEKAA